MSAESFEEQKHDIQQKFISIRSRIDKLINDNKSKSSLECLSIEEFVIDKEKQNQFLIECNERLEEAVQKIKLDNDYNDMLAVRIRQEFYDTMRFHACEIQTLATTPSISASNIPMRKTSKEEEKEIQIIRHLRLSEINDMKRSTCETMKSGLGWTSCLDVIEGGNLLPSLGVESSMNKNPENSIDLDDIYEVNEKSASSSLLYSPLALKTDAQRRIQVILLKDVIRNTAIEFNLKFETIRDDKKNAVKRINYINDRLKEIADMLKIKKEIIDIKALSDNECLESLLDFNSNDSSSEEVSKKNENANEDDPSSRAIDEMMDGTLEEKKSVSFGEHIL